MNETNSWPWAENMASRTFQQHQSASVFLKEKTLPWEIIMSKLSAVIWNTKGWDNFLSSKAITGTHTITKHVRSTWFLCGCEKKNKSQQARLGCNYAVNWWQVFFSGNCAQFNYHLATCIFCKFIHISSRVVASKAIEKRWSKLNPNCYLFSKL